MITAIFRFARHGGLIGGLAALLFSLMSVSASAQASYQISPGDTLTIEVLEDNSLNRSVLVLPDGSINFPLAGAIQAGGRTAAQVQQIVTSGLAPNFAVAPTVFVSVTRLAGDREGLAAGAAALEADIISAFVSGEVNNPGRLEVEPGTTILQVLAQVGGLTRFAADKRIELRRLDPAAGDMKRFLFSYNGNAKGPRISGATQLVDGDVIIVPERRLFE